MTHTEVRRLIAAVDRDLAAVRGPVADASHVALESSWADLVKFLAIAPAGEVRPCPHCGVVGMAAATRCGSCWVALTPVAHA